MEKGIIESVKDKVGMVVTHGKDVVKTGAEALREAKGVIDHSRQDVAAVLARTKDELTQTLKDGAGRVVEKVQRLNTPTHKELAEAKKAEVKAKKREKAAKPQKVTEVVAAREEREGETGDRASRPH